MLEVYVAKDVANHLVAVTVAMLSASAASGHNVEYCRGVVDLARAQALNYGVWGEVQAGVLDGLAGMELLDVVAGLLPGGGA